MQLNIKTIVVGILKENCYIIEKNNKCIVIDPGDEFEKIDSNITCKLIAILITHHHFDHVGALNHFNNVIYDYNNLSEKSYNIGKFSFDVIYTPGHTNDSICFYFKEENIMFTGDFIFKNAIGRTDLGGDYVDMKKSLNKIKNYSDNIKIYPGHGESSTLGEEKRRF